MPAAWPPRTGRLPDRTEEEIRMATARLRVFPHPDDEPVEDFHAPSVPIRLAELYPLLAQAFRDNYVWLRDFEDDELHGQQRPLRGRPGLLEHPPLGLTKHSAIPLTTRGRQQCLPLLR